MRFINISSEFKIILLFLFWRSFLIVVSLFAVHFIPLGVTDRFLGGGSVNYRLFPEFFAWANFDGEHYLSIAIYGYKQFEQAFFPLYPVTISTLTRPLSGNLNQTILISTIMGLLISNASFIFALIILFKLISIDFSKKIALTTILIYLLFPTSFFFVSVYNESLFLFLSICSFYFARNNRWIIASIFGFLASLTRVFGFLLLPSLVLEAYLQKRKFVRIFWIIFIPVGLILYMIYQYLTVGDPIAFYHLQQRVGQQHQQGIILLPQVYYRYIKLLYQINFTQPIYQTIVLEMVVGVLFFLLPIYGYFKKIRLSYLVFALLGFLLTTVQGSFSSLPRYILILFPSFLTIAVWLNSGQKLLKIVIFFSLSMMLILESILFLRGYWVA